MIRGLLLVVQALFWLLLLRFVMRAIGSALARSRGGTGTRVPPQVRAPEDLVLDRVCRTYLPRSRALSARVSGREEWFCSAACRERALAAVARAS
jgi:hypothetical protein